MGHFVISLLFLYFVSSLVVSTIATSYVRATTARPRPVSKDPCYLPAVTGLCQAYFPSFYYDAKADRCKSFVYGGCGGNSNRFQAQRECEKFRYRCLRKRSTNKPHYHRRY